MVTRASVTLGGSGFMHILRILSLSLSVIAAGCCSHRNERSSQVDVPVVSEKLGHKVVPPLAFSQLSEGHGSVVRLTARRIFSIKDGLTEVHSICRTSIVAIADQGGWFFYATSAVTDTTTHQPTQLISGYAIRHGSRQIVSWSIW